MCGITGALSLRKPTVDIHCAKPMADVIAHRGPDDAGYLLFHTGARHNNISFFQSLADQSFSELSGLLPSIEHNHVQRELNQHDWDLFLGHRRLSVLDVSSAGHQPMSDLSKNIWISYNGEIYNFRELRSELELKGHRFKTRTDTEVIIYAYIEWGIECIHRFNGMFAFSLYDNFEKKLYLVRDRYGVKPLYYTQTSEQTLVFASEIKSIVQYSGYHSGIDFSALVEYFTFQNLFTDRTLHENVKMLPAGHYLEVDLSASTYPLKTTKYWDFDFSEPENIVDEREYIEELDRLFCQAVERQLVADVDVGAYLSGGMDSGSIAAIAAKKMPYINTFTIGFDLTSASGMELAFDERKLAEYMSYLFKTEHYEMVLKAGDMERCMSSFAYHLEEPRVGQSYPNYYAAKLASKFVKVVLSGSGGDELFAGYPWRYYRAANNLHFEDYVEKYYAFWSRLTDDAERDELFAPIGSQYHDVDTRKIFSDVFSSRGGAATPEEYVNHSLYFEAKTFLHGLLVVEDKLSMAHSLETRIPFLDNDLVDFAQKVPVKFKLRDLKNAPRMDENEIGKLRKTSDGKVLLRKAMSRHIPQEVYSAAKQGFSSPDQSWFKGDSIDFVRGKLFNKDAIIYNYIDRDVAQIKISEHLEGKKNRRLFIWSLLNVEEWLNQYG